MIETMHLHLLAAMQCLGHISFTWRNHNYASWTSIRGAVPVCMSLRLVREYMHSVLLPSSTRMLSAQAQLTLPPQLESFIVEGISAVL